jgi:hypothetical protein
MTCFTFFSFFFFCFLSVNSDCKNSLYFFLFIIEIGGWTLIFLQKKCHCLTALTYCLDISSLEFHIYLIKRSSGLTIYIFLSYFRATICEIYNLCIVNRVCEIVPRLDNVLGKLVYLMIRSVSVLQNWQHCQLFRKKKNGQVPYMSSIEVVLMMVSNLFFMPFS